jgi:hypothetical protein
MVDMLLTELGWGMAVQAFNRKRNTSRLVLEAWCWFCLESSSADGPFWRIMFVLMKHQAF